MSNLFSGMEAFGLEKLAKNLDVYAGAEGPIKQVTNQTKVNKPQIKEADLLFDKNETCPVCGQNLKTKTVKAGKVKLLSTDTDLRPKYQTVDSLKYDAIVCPNCGYAALRRFFTTVTIGQAKLIKEKISSNFRGLPESLGIYTYEEAIARHKLALLNAVVKKAKSSEKAYICLKTAWLYRGMGENIPAQDMDYEKKVKNCQDEEKQFISKAYDGLRDAFSKESFPLCGMDETTVTYIIADLAIRVGDYDEASRCISRILVSRNANSRVKDKARVLKEILKKLKEVTE